MTKKIFIIGVPIFSCKERPKKEIEEISVQQSGSAVYDDEKEETMKHKNGWKKY
jgi:hypothetical protein